MLGAHCTARAPTTPSATSGTLIVFVNFMLLDFMAEYNRRQHDRALCAAMAVEAFYPHNFSLFEETRKSHPLDTQLSRHPRGSRLYQNFCVQQRVLCLDMPPLPITLSIKSWDSLLPALHPQCDEGVSGQGVCIVMRLDRDARDGAEPGCE